MDQRSLYRDIAVRCEGDIYIGVVGPVRTGKSTFIHKFMELIVLPNMENPHRRERATDELPVSGSGRTIMTTQPQFIPNEAADVHLKDQASARVRLVDCVGYVVPDALGLNEGDEKRMVRTPWYDHDIPLDEAAELGTRKVIREHSTLGIVVTTDGSITDIPRASYEEAEKRVIQELKALGKPFAVVLNSRVPDAEETRRLRDSLQEKYDVAVLTQDVEHMRLDDINDILESLLFAFPLTEIHVNVPDWLSALPEDHYLVQSVMGAVSDSAHDMHMVKDHEKLRDALRTSEYIRDARVEGIRLNEGAVEYEAALADGLFFRILGEASGQSVEGEAHLLTLMKALVDAKKEYDRVSDALASVRATGYGLVAPVMNELTLEQPQIVKQGSRFGVRLKASAPSLHMIRVDIQTEVSPIVGTEKQSEELVQYLLSGFESDPTGLWSTEIFGKTLNDLVREGLSTKLMRMPEDVRHKVQETLQKIINEGNGGMICILL